MIVCLTVPVATTAVAAGPPDSPVCAVAVDAAEQRYHVPKHLLAAIAMAESGRWNAREMRGAPWPWTINAGGTAKFYPTRKAAIAAVRNLRARGVRNIDVGCMQVNLSWHPDAFASLNEAFDPEANADYAARFLKKLRLKRRSWGGAVAAYHSSDPARYLPYRRKVYRLWRAERQRLAAEAWQARRQARKERRNGP